MVFVGIIKGHRDGSDLETSETTTANHSLSNLCRYPHSQNHSNTLTPICRVYYDMQKCCDNYGIGNTKQQSAWMKTEHGFQINKIQFMTINKKWWPACHRSQIWSAVEAGDGFQSHVWQCDVECLKWKVFPSSSESLLYFLQFGNDKNNRNFPFQFYFYNTTLSQY